jgi:hypothetical protein
VYLVDRPEVGALDTQRRRDEVGDLLSLQRLSRRFQHAIRGLGNLALAPGVPLMERPDVLVSPFGIDLEAQQIAELLHLLLQNLPLSRDPLVGRFERRQSYQGLHGDLRSFVAGKRDGVVAFELDADVADG